jgi:hypothetical protein
MRGECVENGLFLAFRNADEDGPVIGHAAHEILGGPIGDDAAMTDDDRSAADGFDLFQDVR